jgi:phospholipid/cholesterol/gamma-HCH transport system permease protein
LIVKQLTSESVGERLFSLDTEQAGSDLLEVKVEGRISIANAVAVMRECRSVLEEDEWRRIAFDLSGIEYLDTIGALVLTLMRQQAQESGLSVTFRSIPDEVRNTLNMIDPKALQVSQPAAALRKRRNPLERLGFTASRRIDDLLRIIGFVGRMIHVLFSSLLHPRTIRWSDALRQLSDVGAAGFPLVGLISFLLGFIVGMLTITQIEAYQARNIIGAVIGIGMLKEFSPFIAAVLVAGRSGSAFAADIGTMMINREVDALVIMGFDPTRFLVVPRLIAVLLAVPILTVFADLFGLLGGMSVVLLTLELPASAFLQQVSWSVSVSEFMLSLLKSVAFAIAIVGVGCIRGFDTRHGSQQVARMTTSAVVTSIVFLIVIDFLFSWITYYF